MAMIHALLTAAVLLANDPVTSAESDAANVIDRMHTAAAVADGEAYFATFTPDARFIGTDATERWPLSDFKAYAEPYFAQGRGWTYVARDRHIEILNQPCRCVAVFDEVLDNESYGEVRGSGVLVKSDDGWKIQQYVLSFTVPNDRAREVVRTIKGN